LIWVGGLQLLSGVLVGDGRKKNIVRESLREGEVYYHLERDGIIPRKMII
jgi:hypothetical protein